MSGPKPNVVFVLGPPGSGKGTQCQKLVEAWLTEGTPGFVPVLHEAPPLKAFGAGTIKRFGYKHLSAGDLLREEKGTPGSQFGEVIDHHIRNGTIVPVEITCRLLDRAMQSSGKSHFLIDGFPRNKDNLDGWNREMSDRVNLQFILFLECPEEVCVQRCLNRGKAGSGRTDDNIESLHKRFKTYTNDTLPIVEYYDKQNLVRRADTSCNDPDEVFRSVAKHFEPYESTK